MSLESEQIRINDIQKKNIKECYVYLDNGVTMELFHDVALKNKLAKGMLIDADSIATIEKQQKVFAAKQTAYNFISYSMRTEGQVREKLSLCNFDEDEINVAIAFLYDFKHLDDYKYCKSFINDYLKKKPSGQKKIKQELVKRGVAVEVVNQVLAETFPAEELFELAKKSAEKKLRTISKDKPLDKQKELLAKHLERSGFSWDLIKPILREYFQK